MFGGENPSDDNHHATLNAHMQGRVVRHVSLSVKRGGRDLGLGLVKVRVRFKFRVTVDINYTLR